MSRLSSSLVVVVVALRLALFVLLRPTDVTLRRSPSAMCLFVAPEVQLRALEAALALSRREVVAMLSLLSSVFVAWLSLSA